MQPLLPETISPSSAKRLRVLLPLPLADAYDYRAEGEAPPPGSFVAVPLGGRQVLGVVWDEAPDSALPEHRLRSIAAVLEAPPMPEKLRRFVDWVAAYTLSPRGAVLRMAMSVPAALEAQPHRAALGERDAARALVRPRQWHGVERLPRGQRAKAGVAGLGLGVAVLASFERARLSETAEVSWTIGLLRPPFPSLGEPRARNVPGTRVYRLAMAPNPINS